MLVFKQKIVARRIWQSETFSTGWQKFKLDHAINHFKRCKKQESSTEIFQIEIRTDWHNRHPTNFFTCFLHHKASTSIFYIRYAEKNRENCTCTPNLQLKLKLIPIPLPSNVICYITPFLHSVVKHSQVSFDCTPNAKCNHVPPLNDGVLP